MRHLARVTVGWSLVAGFLAAGCAGEPEARRIAPFPERTAPAGTTATASAAGGPVEGSGTALDEAPPQRRFRVVLAGRGPGGPLMRVLEDPDATAMPPNPSVEPKVPEPPRVEPLPDRSGPPPLIKIPAPK
jgi:hypothetical protein